MLFGGGGALQEMVYHCKSFMSVQELKSAIVAAWQQLSHAFLERSISEWRCRLKSVAQCNGEHIELVCLTTKDARDFNLSRTRSAFSLNFVK